MNDITINFNNDRQQIVISGEAFLNSLGRKVRVARSSQALSRKALAAKAGISERYLAQIEAGSGNISILLLCQVAGALGLPLATLVDHRDGDSAELALLQRMLTRLPPARLAALRSQLAQENDRARVPAMGRVALVGLRGAGKSTLGSRLGKRLGVPFVELDRAVEQEAGTGLSEIFFLYGQAGYRRYERRCLEKVLASHDRAVIATGGSIVSDPGTYDLLRSACYTVWVKAAPEEHMARVVAQGDTRPIEGSEQAMNDLRRILDSRAPLYGQADHVLDTVGKTVNASLAELHAAVTSPGRNA